MAEATAEKILQELADIKAMLANLGASAPEQAPQMMVEPTSFRARCNDAIARRSERKTKRQSRGQ